MEFRNLTPFDAMCFRAATPSDREYRVVAMKVGYRLVRGRHGQWQAEVNDDRPVPLTLADEYWGEEGASSPREESDLAPYKPRCDVIVNAIAHAPCGRACVRLGSACESDGAATVAAVAAAAAAPSSGRAIDAKAAARMGQRDAACAGACRASGRARQAAPHQRPGRSVPARQAQLGAYAAGSHCQPADALGIRLGRPEPAAPGRCTGARAAAARRSLLLQSARARLDRAARTRRGAQRRAARGRTHRGPADRSGRRAHAAAGHRQACERQPGRPDHGRDGQELWRDARRPGSGRQGLGAAARAGRNV